MNGCEFFGHLLRQKVKNHSISITMSISQILYQTLFGFSWIKDIKHIEQNSVAWVMFQGRDFGVLGAVKTFGVGIYDGAASTAHSSFWFKIISKFQSKINFLAFYILVIILHYTI